LLSATSVLRHLQQHVALHFEVVFDEAWEMKPVCLELAVYPKVVDDLNVFLQSEGTRMDEKTCSFLKAHENSFGWRVEKKDLTQGLRPNHLLVKEAWWLGWNFWHLPTILDCHFRNWAATFPTTEPPRWLDQFRW